MFPFFYDVMIIWFNGPSRDKLIDTLPQQKLEIGCNYIEQVRAVDVVCAFDTEVVHSIKTQPARLYYTRPDAQYPNWITVRDLRIGGGNSGVIACWAAQKMAVANEKIYIIGCDWGLSDNSSDDHIYNKGTQRKFTNNIKKTIERLLHGLDVAVVNGATPDVQFPVITEEHLLQELSNK